MKHCNPRTDELKARMDRLLRQHPSEPGKNERTRRLKALRAELMALELQEQAQPATT